MSRPKGLPLAYDMSGQGVPVVFLHGLTFDRRSWRPIVERLRDRVRSIAVDLPGHGESGGDPVSLDRLATALRAQLDELGIDRPLVVGHSMSGGLALIYAATQPARGAVTVDQPPDVRPFARLVKQLEPALRGDTFAETFLRVFQASMGLELLPSDVRAHVLAGQRIRQDLVLGYWQELLDTEPDTLQARIDRLTDTIRVPVLGVFGRELAPPDRARVTRLPSAAVEQWPGRGHFPHLAEPDRFTECLLRFAARCEASTAAAPAAA